MSNILSKSKPHRILLAYIHTNDYSNNVASTRLGDGYGGGAIVYEPGSTLELHDSKRDNNRAPCVRQRCFHA